MFSFELEWGHSVLYINSTDAKMLENISWLQKIDKIRPINLELSEVCYELTDLPKHVRKQCENTFRQLERIVAIQARLIGKYELRFVDGSIPFDILPWCGKDGSLAPSCTEVQLKLLTKYAYIDFLPKEKFERSPESPQ